MRYRSFGKAGMAISAVSLRIESDARDVRGGAGRLAAAALENGINAFELLNPTAQTLSEVATVLASLERRLVFLSVRLTAEGAGGFSTVGLARVIQPIIAHPGLGYLDLLTLDHPEGASLSANTLDLLQTWREQRAVRNIGVAGEGVMVGVEIATSLYDSVSLPFNLTSGYAERRLLKIATDRDMGVINSDPFNLAVTASDEIAEVRPKRFFPWFRRKRAVLQSDYDFLKRTRGWTPEEICIAWALAEPAIASVQVCVRDPKRLAELATAPDRDLPTNLTAQIEMARFSGQRARRA